MHNNKDLEKLRHSAAHLLAQAILDLYPNTLLTIGPATDEGFFYDVLPTHSFTQEDLPKLEERMRELAQQNLAITHQEIPKEEARKLFAHNPFKLELINTIPGDTVGLSQQGSFIDLCKGGHVASTGLLKNIKLLGISGSYWRADKNNAALQRISGTVFFTQEDLDAYLKHKEEAAQYDHRKLGKELDLFSFHEEGPGFPFYHPHGKAILNRLTEFLREKLALHNYKEVSTPTMLSADLWKQSGHASFYEKNMYFSKIDDRDFAIKPMNCPGAILIYKERPHSYRDLPLRLAEFGLVHRYELSGALHGLFRVRAFTQDDAHIFCTPDQIEAEVETAITLIIEVFKTFQFQDITVGVSTKPQKAMGQDERWQQGTNLLIAALEKHKIPYKVFEGEGAFYGPKIDFNIKDSMGREWQCGTVQIDYVQPENFDLTYVASSGAKERPIIIHRAIYGSLDRFFGILIEHFKGKFPFWLAPVQMRILTITDAQMPYAQELYHLLKNKGYRVDLDTSSDPIAGKIKAAQLTHVPWMLIIGKKEVEQKTISIRHFDGTQRNGIPLLEFFEDAAKKNEPSA